MTKQEIAIQLSKINWMAAEADDANVWDELNFLRDELNQLEKKEIIKVFYAVMQAKHCAGKHPEVFNDMLEFKYINS